MKSLSKFSVVLRALGSFILAAVMVLLGIQPAQAAPYSASAWDLASLQTAFTNAVGSDATVTITNSINGASGHVSVPAGVTITLDLNSYSLTLGADGNSAAIEVPSTSAIIIKSGTLTATGGTGSAAIGGSLNMASGSITIQSGTYNLTGANAAAIGGGYQRGAGPITISGGTITATTFGGAGIGGGFYGNASSITITAGDITTTGYKAIGGGWSGTDGVLYLPTTSNTWTISSDYQTLAAARGSATGAACSCLSATLTPVSGTDYTVTGTTNGTGASSLMTLHIVFGASAGPSSSPTPTSSSSATVVAVSTSSLPATGQPVLWLIGMGLLMVLFLGVGAILLFVRVRARRH